MIHKQQNTQTQTFTTTHSEHQDKHSAKTEEQFSTAGPVNSETQLVSGTDVVTVFLQLIAALRL